jgi:hypothetical protein
VRALDVATLRSAALMNDAELQATRDLVEKYSAAAAAHGRATEHGEHKSANKAHKTLASAYRELRHRGDLGCLRALIDHQDAGVRLWAASHALEFAPVDAEAALVALSSMPNSLVAVSARTTLKEWKAGKLAFP